MIIDHSAASGLRLLEAEDFKGFKLRLSNSERRPALSGVTFVDDDNVLIAIALPPTLRGAPSSDEWRAGYQSMINYAARKGWIDAATQAIRAHVERVS